MTQQQEELLWKYIDGQCTEEETSYVLRILDDPATLDAYSSMKELDRALKTQKLSVAPEDLIQNTMKTLLQANPKLSIVPQMNYTPLIFVLSLVFGSTLLIFLLPMTKSTHLTWLTGNFKRMTDIHWDLSGFASLNNMGIALLSILLLYFIDLMLFRKRVIFSL